MDNDFNPDLQFGSTNGSRRGRSANGQRGPDFPPEDEDWRSRANQTFVKRSQTASKKKTNQKRPAPVLPMRLPRLPNSRKEGEAVANEDENSGPASSTSTNRPSSKRRRRPGSGKSKSKKQAIDETNLLSIVKNREQARVDLNYELPPPDPVALYRNQMTELEKLPLELFDSEEYDRSPYEWIQLGVDKYDEKGTPARSPFFYDRKWSWMPCRVIGYDAETAMYTIRFPRYDKIKTVKRLSLLFDDEDEVKFRKRVKDSKRLKESCLAIRRYTQFVETQADDMHSPIQQSALHGIVTRLMKHVHNLVMARQNSVEALLIEVRDCYNLAMKQAIVDQNRLNIVEVAKMAHLNLPPLQQRQDPPYLGTIPIAKKKYSVKQLVNLIQMLHYTVNPESTQVILATFQAWTTVKKGCFFQTEYDKLKLPMTLFDYQDFQEEHFKKHKKQVLGDWRYLVLNLIRDNLTGVFQLFCNTEEEAAKSGLKRFLKMVTLMLKEHMQTFVEDSIGKYLEHFRTYANPQGRLSSTKKHDILKGYVAPQAKLLLQLDPGRPAGPFLRPLFEFRLIANENEVVFMPELKLIKEIIYNLVDLPSKLTNVTDIDSDVTPMLGLKESPLLTREHLPWVFEETEKVQEELATIITDNMQQPLALAELYQKYGSVLLPIDVNEYIKAWFPTDAELTAQWEEQQHNLREAGMDWSSKGESEPPEKPTEKHPLKETIAEITRFLKYADEITNLSPTFVTFRMIKVDASLAKEQLVSKARLIADRLMLGLSDRVHGQNVSRKIKMEAIFKRIRQKSTHVSDLAELKALVSSIEETEIPHMFREILYMRRNIEALESFQFSLPRENSDLSWGVASYPQLILRALDDTKDQMELDNAKFQKKLQEEQALFLNELEEYAKEVDTFRDFGTGSPIKMEQNAAKVDSLQENLEKAAKQVESFKERDILFSGQVMDYTESMANDLNILKEKFRPYLQLWSVTSYFITSYALWMTRPFIELDAKKITEDVQTWYKLMYKLEREFNGENAIQPARVAFEMKEKIAEFKDHVPVIQWLRSPGLRDRHWDSLSKILCPGRAPLSPDSELTLSQILTFDVAAHKVAVEEISICADKEYILEQTLEKMAKEWRMLNLDLEAYKNTKTYILKGSEDIIMMLDDQIMKTQGMRGSPYIKPFELRTKKWEARLHHVSNIMDEWLRCQKTWVYLEPIFSSDDILRQMPVEGRRFKTVDAYWRKTMEAAFQHGNAMDFLSETDNLLKTFEESNKMLDLIGRGLNEYLETKRLAFPRFYFLSNDELLSILSQTKNATAVQPHLNKCFDAVTKLEFTVEEHNELITGMYSPEGEYVKFHKKVNPTQGPKRGNVELWLKEVEDVIFKCMQHLHRHAITSYPTSDAYLKTREQWILEQPGQVVLSVSQLFFTRAVTFALRDGGNKGLQRYLNTCHKQLEKLVKLVRGDLSKLARKTCSALTVVDVHARDILEKMVRQNVVSHTDFEWLSQLRYYWEGDGSKERKGLGKTGLERDVPPPNAEPPKLVDDGILQVRIINSCQYYGYEYLGNSMRLVITPLTDRCYRTLMGAVHLHLGGAPEGPAGTGKTETVKDLAKAVAIQCIVFNCSDGLNYLHMAKMFKGLAASGAWACFDEFNRIELEVLSVIAQQISSIQRAIQEGKHTMVFDAVNIPVVHTCSVFITMNPGYAGRAELPDNLKALFRTVAMMIPDYALIAQIILYSYGYMNAKDLARKTVSCLRLSSEQLSSQDHYDFGMRAVNSILKAAGKLKRELPEADEAELCVNALKDVNIPKFVSADVPLFEGIVQDLFPMVVDLPSTSKLEGAILESLAKRKLQERQSFITKINELCATFEVRHGLMVVGSSFSGKSTNLKVLSDAVTSLAGEGSFGEVKSYYINPKSINLRELYGADDEATQEWKDGVLAVTMRKCIQHDDSCWKWVVFDGPVDAIWIENMNTVLDDNRKLCLASGESIRLAPRHTMVFEVEDLAVASPATVSRCGMVYMEPGGLGWEPIFQSWLEALPHELNRYRDDIKSLVHWILPDTLYFLKHNCKPLVPRSDIGMVVNMMKLFDCMIRDVLACLEKPLDWSNVLESYFIFSVIWSLGCGTDLQGRQKFSHFLVNFTTGKLADDEDTARKLKCPLPVLPSSLEVLVYDFKFNLERRDWQNWMADQQLYEIPEGAAFTSIIVPTLDTVRTGFIMGKLIKFNHHVLLTGDTGTGKSIVIKQKLLNLVGTDFTQLTLSFSARTTAKQTQEIIDDRVDRKRSGVFGPPTGKTMIIFVDDLNMPAKEVYGAQPAIELLRQWMDYKGWYDVSTNTFKNIVDIQFLAAMGPPGGGRNDTTYRYLRHFHSICTVPFSNASLRTIFGTILTWWMSSFTPKLRSLQRALVDSTISLYNKVTSQLLPTPSKSHYTYNLRDVSKVFQGIMCADVVSLPEQVDIIRLWFHECTRVFSDRLATQDDLDLFAKMIKGDCEEHFKVPPETILDNPDGNPRPLVFANFADPQDYRRPYVEVTDIATLSAAMEGYLDDYNQMKKNKMSLVLFLAAIEHVSRISRIIETPLGNALLMGVGGSGRQSLTRLAAFIADYDVYQIELVKNYGINEWRDDLRDVMRKSGCLNKPIVFLLTDTQIKDEAFVEDVNHILNNGEVPNLFPPEEYLPIIEAILPDARKAERAESNQMIFDFFIERCKNNIHMVLCFSPVGETFRNRLLMFPALVNCCTIDWFHPWPTDALKSVATEFLEDVNFEDDIKYGVVDVCVDMQERVKNLNTRYLEELGRHNYVTPTSYLELLKLFRNLFEAKRKDIKDNEERYVTGLEKLDSTEVAVKAMQLQLTELQPKLIVSQKKTNELMEVVEKETNLASKQRAATAKEEAVCNKHAAAASEIAQECNAALAEALPALGQAMKALRVVQKRQLDELKSMKVPTAGVLLTIEALCIMMEVTPRKVGQVGRKTLDYWEPAKKHLLSDTKFMQRLEKYDKDNIPDEVIAKVRPFVTNPDFSPSKIANASKAAEGFCKWVIAMECYDRVVKQVAPKRQALKEAKEKQSNAEEALKRKKGELQAAEDKLAALNAKFKEANDKKQDLERQVKKCELQLDRAEKLIGGLAGEKIRWLQKASDLGKAFLNVVGDILISSGVIAYLGVFTSVYRKQCISEWVRLLTDKGIKCTQDFKLREVLGSEVKIREWAIQGLPKDELSISNAIMLTRGIRWGLLIDPQEQANRWIRNMEDENNQLKVIKQTDDTFTRILSTSVQVGFPILVEDVKEDIDPSLAPVLGKQLFKQGSRDMIRVAGETIEYNKDFRLYLTTKLPNPHYSPETAVKVTLICFMTTPEGLEDQMLSKVVSQEEPALEQERDEIIVKNSENTKQLQQIEDKILEHLHESKGMILDDENLIQTLQKSKQASSLIEKRLASAAKTKQSIDQTRMEYKGVAASVSNLFFCISDLANIDPMYQYSLTWFTKLFTKAIKDAEESKDVHMRTHNIEETFLLSLYRNVCRSLFEKDKLIFSFLLCLRICKDEIDPLELRFLLTGYGDSINVEVGENKCKNFPLPDSDGEQDTSQKVWLPDSNWGQLYRLSRLKAFGGFLDYFCSHQKQWRQFYEAVDPLSRPLPGAWERNLSLFQKMLVLRALRPDKIVLSAQMLVKEKLGVQFTQPPAFDLSACFSDSNFSSPLIFVLSPGVDPSTEVFKLAAQWGYDKHDRFVSISLGQGQGPLAEKAIAEAMEKGTWVLLQNCHLLVSWLPTLQKIIDDINPNTANVDFRLWLTSMPSPAFPVSILQNGVKITNEPPKGLKANLEETYSSMDEEWVETAKRPEALKKLMYGLAFFHAVCLERRKFGPMGWNIKYEWTRGDMAISKTQLKMFLDLYSETPVVALRYCLGQLNYGGRVTDEWDTRTISFILTDFICAEMIEDDYHFDIENKYGLPPLGADLEDYRRHIREIPEEDTPEIFGLHGNVNITASINDTNAMFSTLLLCQPRSAGGGAFSRDDVVGNLAKDIARQLPEPFDVEEAEVKYPVDYENSMNTVLVQELIRYNRLLNVMLKSLTDIQKAIKGEVVMSMELDSMAQSMFNGRVPDMWSNVAYPSLKPLSSWVEDFLLRLKMYSNWVKKGAPAVYWISGLFFTQSFLTGTMQDYARRHEIAIDMLAFEFEVLPNVDPDQIIPAVDGCYIHGLFLDGARWDAEEGVLAEPYKRQLNSPMPTIWLKPCERSKMARRGLIYPCPVYKTSLRFGVLSTTGRSTNFIVTVNLPSTQAEKHWVKRGVALLTQLDE